MKSNCQGFTLLEVMMALIIISVGLMALVQSTQYSANTLLAAKSKTSAYHVADQVLMRLYTTADLTVGVHSGEQRFQNQTYYWQATLSKTDNNHIDRLDVLVSLDRQINYAEAQLTGFKKS